VRRLMRQASLKPVWKRKFVHALSGLTCSRAES